MGDTAAVGFYQVFHARCFRPARASAASAVAALRGLHCITLNARAALLPACRRRRYIWSEAI